MTRLRLVRRHPLSALSLAATAWMVVRSLTFGTPYHGDPYGPMFAGDLISGLVMAPGTWAIGLFRERGLWLAAVTLNLGMALALELVFYRLRALGRSSRDDRFS